jgi:hypothetical protein
MGDMVTYHLKEFEKNTRALPDNIIMYRDGVSESVSLLVHDAPIPNQNPHVNTLRIAIRCHR